MPHNIGIVPGGVTEKPTEDKMTNFLSRLNEIRSFIDNSYIPDVLNVAKAYKDYFAIGIGCRRMLSYGGFELPAGKRLFQPATVSEDLRLGDFDMKKITEYVKYSWYADSTSGKNPAQGETVPEPEKKDAYSFIKAPRYQDQVYEGGPIARILIKYLQQDKAVKPAVDNILADLGAGPRDLVSVIGRHAARALETKLIADTMVDWVQGLDPDGPIFTDYTLPDKAEGAGLTDAPRGNLGHWISIKDKKVSRYQIITPTAWNASPKDDKGRPGPVEQAVIGTKVKDKDNPFEIVRIIRAYDPCLACSVHLMTPKGAKTGEFEVV